MRQLRTEKQPMILSTPVEGNSVNATARPCGASKVTVLRPLADAGTMSDMELPRQQDDLVELLADANFCLMALGDLRRDYGTVEAISWRMEGGGEDRNFFDRRDEADCREAQRRIESNMQVLTERLAGVLSWGLHRGMEIAEDLGMLNWENATAGVKAEVCGGIELDVRAVVNAILVEQTRERQKVEQPRRLPPAKIIGEGDETEQAPALKKSERLTLGALATFDPAFLASAENVADAMDRAERRSDRTIRDAIRRLVELDLAERPEGKRQGARLTIRGRRLASKIAG